MSLSRQTLFGRTVAFMAIFLVSCRTFDPDNEYAIINHAPFEAEILLADSGRPIRIAAEGGRHRLDSVEVGRPIEAAEFLVADDLRVSLLPGAAVGGRIEEYLDQDGLFHLRLPEWVSAPDKAKGRQTIWPDSIGDLEERKSFARHKLACFALRGAFSKTQAAINRIAASSAPGPREEQALKQQQQALNRALANLRALSARVTRVKRAKTSGQTPWTDLDNRIVLLRLDILVSALEMALIRRRWGDYAFYLEKYENHRKESPSIAGLPETGKIENALALLERKKTDIVNREGQRLRDHEEILSLLRIDDEIIAEAKLYRYGKLYGGGVFSGYEFLRNEVEQKMEQAPWIRFAFGFQARAGLAANFDLGLAYGSAQNKEQAANFNDPPLVYDAQLGARLDFILAQRFTLGIDFLGGWHLANPETLFGNFFNNASLAESPRPRNSLSKVRYNFDLSQWWSDNWLISLGLNFQYRHGGGSVIFIPGFSFSQTRITNFEVEKAAGSGVWRNGLENNDEVKFTIDILRSFSLDFAAGYGFYLGSDHLKLEFLGAFSFVPRGEADSFVFSNEVPANYLQSRFTLGLRLYTYFDSNLLRGDKE